MKIILLGATGNTGIQLAIQACQRGHQVTAVVRNPDKLKTISDQNLKIVQCKNMCDSDELAEYFKDHDCVLSGLGSPGFTLFRVTFPLDSMKAILPAMRKANIKRIICVGSQYTKPNLPTYPTIYKVILRPMIGRQLDALNEMEDFLFSESNADIDFTIVRPPQLLDTPLSEIKEIAAADIFHFSDGSTTAKMSRANVARFMLDILDSNEYLKKGVSIDMPK